MSERDTPPFFPFVCFDHLSAELHYHEDEDDGVAHDALRTWIQDDTGDASSFPLVCAHSLWRQIRAISPDGAGGDSSSAKAGLSLAQQAMRALTARCSISAQGMASVLDPESSISEPASKAMSETWELLKLSLFFAAHYIMAPERIGVPPKTSSKASKADTSSHRLLQSRGLISRQLHSVRLSSLECLAQGIEVLNELCGSGTLDKLPARDRRGIDKVRVFKQLTGLGH